MSAKLLWKILEAKLTASDDPTRYPLFVRFFRGTEEEARQLIDPEPRYQASLLPFDEIRNHYADKKLAAHCQEEGRIKAICSQVTDKDLRPSILNVIEETREEIERLRAAESETIIANLSYQPAFGTVLLSASRPQLCPLCSDPSKPLTPEDNGVHTACAQEENARDSQG